MTVTDRWRRSESGANETHPLSNGGVWVDVVLELLCVATGERRHDETYTPHYPNDDGDTLNPFYYAEGNGSCDCNRALYFKRAGGESTADDETACGDTAYRLNLRNPVTGEVVYREFE